jgi:hypothetical protein
MKKRFILITTLILIAIVACFLIADGLVGPKSLAEIEAEIDNAFLADVGTTYYGNWLFTKSEVREMEHLRITLGLSPQEREELARLGITLDISEDEWIDLWVGVIREGTNWVDLYYTHVFDCSEMAALAECLFEQMGFDSYIAVSLELGHAWVLIRKSDGSHVPVEATGMFVVTDETVTTGGLTRTDYLHQAEKLFTTIYKAEFLHPREFDWWNAPRVEKLTLNEAKMDEFISKWMNEWMKKYGSWEVLLTDEVIYLEYGQYWHSSTVFEEGDEIEVTVEVKQGGPVDVLLLDSAQYYQFEQFMNDRKGSFTYFVAGSALNVMSKSYTFQIPGADRYYVVISNAGGIERGARPEGDVAVYLKVVAIVHL